MELYDVCRNTVTNWGNVGLRSFQEEGPKLFRGLELNRLHAWRSAQGRQNLRLDQFFCLCCKVAVLPDPLSVNRWQNERGSRMAGGACSECGASVMKLLDASGYERLENVLRPNVNLSEIDERKDENSVGVGTKAPLRVPEWPSMNDRIIYNWQLYAGRFSEKNHGCSPYIHPRF